LTVTQLQLLGTSVERIEKGNLCLRGPRVGVERRGQMREVVKEGGIPRTVGFDLPLRMPMKPCRNHILRFSSVESKVEI
jgi:hypothetical protein